MILADKIIQLRKQAGWSQEELAEQLQISRQAVSKWESAASVPDLDKVLLLSRLFGVSTDELLKDELSLSATGDLPAPDSPRTVQLEEAHNFLSLRERLATPLALAVSLCVLSPVPLLLLCGLAERGRGISEDFAGGVGVALILLLAAAAVAMFLIIENKLSPYAYLEKESFSLTFGVSSLAEEKKRVWAKYNARCTVVGVCLCILSAAPLLLAAALDLPDSAILFCVSLLLMIIALATFLFVKYGTLVESCDMLLETGSFSAEEKGHRRALSVVGTVYWSVVTALYLGYSLTTMRWETSWVIWPVAALLYAAISALWKLRRIP